MKNKKHIILSAIAARSLWCMMRVLAFIAIIGNGALSFGAAAPALCRPIVRAATTAEAVFEKMKNNLECAREANAQEYAAFKAGNISHEQFERKAASDHLGQIRLAQWKAKPTYGRQAGIINMAKNGQFESDTYHRNIQALQNSPGFRQSPIKDQFGKTPLMWAAQVGQVDMMRQLLKDKIAFVDELDYDNGSALRWAMNGPQDSMGQVVELLLANGAQSTINIKTTGVDPMTGEASQRTPLQWLLRRHSNSMAKGQIGASVAVLNFVAQQLLNAGADPLIKDKSAKTAIYWALALNDFDLALELYGRAEKRQIDRDMQLSFVEAVLRASQFMGNYVDVKTTLRALQSEMRVPVDQLLVQALDKIILKKEGAIPGTGVITQAEAGILVENIMPLLVGAQRPALRAQEPKGPAAATQPVASRAKEKAPVPYLAPAQLERACEPVAAPRALQGYEKALTPDQIALIADLQRDGLSLNDIADMLNLPSDQIAQIMGGASAPVALRQALAQQEPGLRPDVRVRPAVYPGVVPQPAAPRSGTEISAQTFRWIEDSVEELVANVDAFFNQLDWNNQPFALPLFTALNAVWRDARHATGYDMTRFDRVKERLQKYAQGRQKKKGLPAKEQDDIRGALALGVFQ